MNKHIVVCRYKENVDWIDTIKDYEPKIYFKNNCLPYNNLSYSPKINMVPNIGREEFVYLRYIIDHYHELPDQVVFTQGRPFDHSTNFISLLNDHSNKFSDIQPLTDGHSYGKCPDKVFRQKSSILNVANIPLLVSLYDKDMRHYCYPLKKCTILLKNDAAKSSIYYYLGAKRIDKRKELSKMLNIDFRNIFDQEITPMCFGAIFSVNKEVILQHPKSFYEHLIFLCEKFNNRGAFFGYVMEYSWLEIFRYNPPTQLYF